MHTFFPPLGVPFDGGEVEVYTVVEMTDFPRDAETLSITATIHPQLQVHTAYKGHSPHCAPWYLRPERTGSSGMLVHPGEKKKKKTFSLSGPGFQPSPSRGSSVPDVLWKHGDIQRNGGPLSGFCERVCVLREGHCSPAGPKENARGSTCAAEKRLKQEKFVQPKMGQAEHFHHTADTTLSS